MLQSNVPRVEKGAQPRVGGGSNIERDLAIELADCDFM
jgi:hypothetical protein